jgi:hypothetical protein
MRTMQVTCNFACLRKSLFTVSGLQNYFEDIPGNAYDESVRKLTLIGLCNAKVQLFSQMIFVKNQVAFGAAFVE